MTLVFDQPVSGAATHALVIGVGAYAHLPGGSGPLFLKHEGLSQLSSPPHSAREVATWLLSRYRNDANPLATLELLISDDLNSGFVLPDGEVVGSVERATFQNVRDAIRQRWFARGDANQEHMLIFFFCGHGVSRGQVTSLLMEDFGSWDRHPLEQAIDFRQFCNGMDKCAARRQVYFIDSCRKASPALIEEYDNYTGEAIIPGSAFYSSAGARYTATYYATVPDESAYGRPEQASVFTEALLKAMDGIGSEETDDGWLVSTVSLQNGLDELMRRMLRDAPGLAQVSSAEAVRFPLHSLHGKPNALVTIRCKPREANKIAKLGYMPDGETNKVIRDPDESDWEVETEAGDYQFSAEFTGGPYHNSSLRKYVYPARRVVPLEVGS